MLGEMDYSFPLDLDDLLDYLGHFDDPWEEDELIQLNQERFDSLYRGSECWVAGSQSPQFHDQKIQLHLDILGQHPVSLLMSGHIYSDCDSERLLLDHLMDVLQYLNDLRHDDDLLNDLLQDIRHLN